MQAYPTFTHGSCLSHCLRPGVDGECEWPFASAFRMPASPGAPVLPLLHSVASEPLWEPFKDGTQCKLRVHADLAMGKSKPSVEGLVFSLKLLQLNPSKMNADLVVSIHDWFGNETLLCRKLQWCHDMQEIGTVNLTETPAVLRSPGIKVRVAHIERKTSLSNAATILDDDGNELGDRESFIRTLNNHSQFSG